ncbi:MAG: adenylate cyclase [Alphaproteobacteria bacterium]|nr:adenylate cyclase [Alphaproteobacteria bacterium]
MERRLAAVMAADMVGYSRQMGQDDKGTLGRLQRFHAAVVDPVIGRHGGHVIKTMGDGFLAEFASVVDAVRAAIALQEGVRALNAQHPEEPALAYRIGLTLGDVIVEGGDVIVEGGDLFGEGVNIAARLEGLAGAGQILASEAVVQQVGQRAGIDFTRIGPHRLKNIAAPVTVYRVTHGGNLPPERRRWAHGALGRFGLALGLAGALALVVGGAAVYLWPRPAPSPAVTPSPTVAELKPVESSDQQPTIAVLPFVNQSGDSGQDYLADGMTEDVIAALGRFPSIAVLSRLAVERFRSADAAEISRALAARYLVAGSVRRAGDQARVQAQLLDQGGRLIWSDRFEGDARDIFALQDAIVRQVVGVLAARIARFEQACSIAKPAENLQAYDLLLRARYLVAKATRRDHAEARRLVAHAVELDPGYADAHALLAQVLYDYQSRGYAEDPMEIALQAESHARQAIVLDPASARGQAILGRIHSLFGRHREALAALERAIRFNPSDAEAQMVRGAVLLWLGRPTEAVAAIEQARRFEPVMTPDRVFALGLSLVMIGRPDQARALVEETIDRFRHISFQHAALAIAYAAMG